VPDPESFKPEPADPEAPKPEPTKPERPKRPRRSRKLPPGTAPGTLSIDPQWPKPRLTLIAYGPDAMVEETIADVGRLGSFVGRWPVVWLNVDGLGDESTLVWIGELFGIHRLSLEDILNTHQRPKLEAYDKYLFMIARMLTYGARIEVEQLSMVLGQGFLLTFQETAGDGFDPVRARLRDGRGRLRYTGSGYLAYTLLDAVVDNYFPVLERFGERLEAIEDEAMYRPTRRTVQKIHDTKRELLLLRRSIWPQRDMLNALLRQDTPLLQAEDRLYLQDCYDHAVRVMELADSHREIGSGLMEVYLSSVSNRLNEVVKVLTVFTSIFIPLSFIASVYGMNFDTSHPANMPELRWRWGYAFSLGLMGAVAGGLLYYFWRKGWLSGDNDEGPRER
jgi:magnesium transporter